MDSLSPSAAMQYMLGKHPMVRAHYNANHPQLRLPPEVLVQCRAQGHGAVVMLELGYNMPVPIRDWDFGEEDLMCTCSFNRVPFACVLPWEALIMVSPGDDSVQCVWPAALREASIAEGERAVECLDKLLENTKPNHLRVVK